MRCALSAVLCLALPIALNAQNSTASLPAAQTPTIRANTQIVIVDVNVTDARGNAVHNLKQSDFTLTENNNSQTISHFEEHAAVATAASIIRPKIEPNVYTNYTPVPENSAINVVLLDALNTPITDQSYARQQMLNFVKSMKPGTPIAIFGLNTRLVLLQGFTSNPEILQAALSGKKSNGQTSALLPNPVGTESGSDQLDESFGNDPLMAQVIAGVQQFEAQVEAQQNRLRTLYTLSAMNQLARYLSGLPGRKNLIWFSGSFPISILPNGDLQNPFSVMESMEDEFRETTSLLARSQVAVYPVDARGLFVNPMFSASNSGAKYARNPQRLNQDMNKFTQQTFDEHSTMQQMADATGGHAFYNTNDLTGSVAKAIDSGSNYYTLVYSPSDKSWNGKFRKLKVTIGSGTYTLTYRRGYYADDPNPKTKSKSAEAATPQNAVQATSPASVTPHIDSMRSAMQRGAPDPTEIFFKALVMANPATSDTLPNGNSASAKLKPPYRIVDVVFAVDPTNVSLPPNAGGRELAMQFVTIAYDRDGQGYTSQANPVHIVVKPESSQQFLKEGIRYHQQIAIPAKGEYFLRIGVHDLIGDKVGAIEVSTDKIGTLPVQSTPAPK